MASRVVPLLEVNKFIMSALRSSGGQAAQAKDLADLLIAADTRGHYSHGLNRLEMYCCDLRDGSTDKDAAPVIEKETVSTSLVNGNDSLGPTVGKFSMNLAIAKAKSTGIGVVSARASNHYGIAGYYGLMAKDQGLIGMSMTNTSPLQVPTRGKQVTLGTNPLTVVAPAQGEDYFALDMATSTAALGKVEVAKRKAEAIPTGWGCDSGGLETLDPSSVLQGGGLLPLGGAEQSGGYKGYGLAMMVEVLCGVLAGAHWGPHVRKWQDTSPDREKADLGQFFLALDPSVFGAGFEGRLQEMLDLHRGLEPITGESEVLVAGDPERRSEAKVERDGGITYHPALIRDMEEFAKDIGIQPMVPL